MIFSLCYGRSSITTRICSEHRTIFSPFHVFRGASVIVTARICKPCVARSRVFDGVGSTLYTTLYLRKLIDEGTGSTFNALESRGFIKCKYTWKRRDGGREALERFLMLQITKEGRALVRSAPGAKAYRPGAPGALREWHWKAMVEAWKAQPAGVKDENGY